MVKKILIINEGYSSNLGDQAIKKSMESLLRKLGYETDFCYFTNPALKNLPVYQYKNKEVGKVRNSRFSIYKKTKHSIFSFFIYFRYFFKIKKQIRAYLQNRSYHAVIIGGGQLINSSKNNAISFFSISLYLWTIAVKKDPTIMLYLAGVGVAGKFHLVEKYLYKKALNKTDSIWVRDRFSQKSLSSNFNKQSILMPDVAFFQEEEFIANKNTNTALVGIYSYNEYIRKFNTAEKNKDTYYKNWLSIVERLIAKKMNIILFYTTESDALETLLFQQYLQTKQLNTQVADIKSLDDLNKLLENADVVCSARMHALILGLKKGCSAETYIISQKLKSFCEEYIDNPKTPEVLSETVYNMFNNQFLNQGLTVTK
ncbi:MAG: polysaccharide pyruvyl transferase family protein [Ferruginibacter sp.]|nr:polysaccharide pyruvyl transferase family protein [Ferruginibacter sp.]